MTWRTATVSEIRTETASAHTLLLDVPGWPGHMPGQHVDIRLIAEDGYTATRSYSIGSTPAEGTLEVSVQRLPDGEVSPYLVDTAQPGDQFEVRGPIGGYFVWRTEDTYPVLLVAGGSGVVPLMSMIRARKAVGSRVPFRLIYGTRSPDDAFYAMELARRVRDDQGMDLAYAYSREVPPEWTTPPSRVDGRLIATAGWPADLQPGCFVCGPTGFVETVANILVEQGHPAERIRTERFGPTGG